MTATKEQIVAALKQLDVTNDNHWTSEGAPRMETMRLLSGDNALSRDAVLNVRAAFSRATAASINLDEEPAADAPPVSPQPGSEGDGAALNDAVATSQVQPDPDKGPSEESVDPIEAARARVRAAQAGKTRAEAELAAAYKAEEALTRDDPQRSAAVREHDRAANVKRYLESQKAVLEHRGEQMAALKGVDLKSILPQAAPIDRAFARKFGFGRQRPVFPAQRK